MKSKKRKKATNRVYAAKLLFQFRVSGSNRKRVPCEQRILHIKASSGKEALATAKRMGKDAQFRYKNTDGTRVHFQFIGVQDLIGIGIEWEPNEVWYELIMVLSPMERKTKLIPPENELPAIWLDRC